MPGRVHHLRHAVRAAARRGRRRERAHPRAARADGLHREGRAPPRAGRLRRPVRLRRRDHQPLVRHRTCPARRANGGGRLHMHARAGRGRAGSCAALRRPLRRCCCGCASCTSPSPTTRPPACAGTSTAWTQAPRWGCGVRRTRARACTTSTRNHTQQRATRRRATRTLPRGAALTHFAASPGGVLCCVVASFAARAQSRWSWRWRRASGSTTWCGCWPCRTSAPSSSASTASSTSSATAPSFVRCARLPAVPLSREASRDSLRIVALRVDADTAVINLFVPLNLVYSPTLLAGTVRLLRSRRALKSLDELRPGHPYVSVAAAAAAAAEAGVNS